MSSDQIVYDTYYSLYLQQNVDQYLSWTNIIQDWAYLYSSPKALWFVKVNGPNSGPVLTGDILQIEAHIGVGSGLTSFLRSRGLNDWTANWSGPPDSACNWALWTDDAKTSGLPIVLGQTVYIENQDPSYIGNYLIQYLPQYPDYLTVGPNTVPFQFQVRNEDGSVTLDRSDIKRAPLPPDAVKV